ncbi:MAG TPA: hypothetical protein VMZ71_01750 [Gemmataceae bacterium]|nr:hypothetical protein [Gemmataceae bacterium]
MSNEGWRRGSSGGDGDGEPDDGLGSLAQSARRTSFKQARGILFALGGLTIVGYSFLFLNVEKEADEAINAEVQKHGGWGGVNPNVANEVRATIIRVGRIIYAGTVALGAVFVLLGFLVPTAPVACTVTGLVLYIASIAVFAVIDPLSLVRGFIIKIVVIVCMVKAVQAAVAYERELKEAKAARDDDHDPDAF